ncbi:MULTISPECIES: linear amide C-N hydrolase [Chryseobacterium]|uniref:Penicillin V acylase-like amidase (Ntn superfamily) n=1 Tax=Chryseobacterium camelliae TaxID=1265445 RepID=A0ABU0TDZ3_9FLAO|nr:MULTISPECIES: linear amide C-N hydrolase [Chryseobacterium]MDT3407042.1 penicillin V acylase-like amidase (Ntn superfamily) [Pseudacidovorax intermedius]MDQ1095166.1 penicillin V acylase-like amidase (Ntn superfamily) [Chryseobacterium camelliae]MDQ1099104.1 penicillin V acylase-like amidase (Ntn superfamily) [Chryseobacterium sp. SORGH_AS_1048]MDR6086453.1 penicillin V acylase-like amidase (Ntn superfamily) [Chryseobacterium sp. SORGH_AS_0909]MDR6130825.1 penicillin V acylase-like amidase 
MRYIFSRCLLFVLLMCSAAVSACSAFLLKGHDYCVVGFNENWKTMPGMIVVNKRGILKRNISWENLTTDSAVPATQWKSRYGSVTFNLLGYDFPCYGVNEKGLFLVELYLEETGRVRNPSQPDMFWAQWIQYQLDHYTSVKEVVNNLNKGPNIDWWPNAAGSHFFLTDARGNTATIALLDGKYKVLTDKDMPMPLLCNNQYHKDLQEVQKFDFLGGKEKFSFDQMNQWENRYSRAYYMMKNYTQDKKPVDYAWNILNSIHPGEWQTVIDVKNMNLYFRSDLRKEIKTINLSGLDFSQNASVRYLDIHTDRLGEVNKDFEVLTLSKNNEYVEKGFPVGYDNKEFPVSDIFTTIKRNIAEFFRNILPAS